MTETDLRTARRQWRGPRRRRWGNRLALAILHSPLRFLLDPGICELGYTARRSGQPVRLPVIYAREGDTLAVLVGNAPAKTWWRNFATPRSVQVHLRGRPHDGTARLVRPGDPAYDRTAAIYQRRHPDVHGLPGDRLVAITLWDPEN